jgi:hypothetical protein
VNHRNARNPQGLEAIDHRMGTADLSLHRGSVGRAAEGIDVGAGDEAGLFGGTDDETRRALAFKLRQHLVELFDQVGRKRIGAGALAVE